MKVIFDIETDGLLEDVTKIHCLSYKEYGSDKVHTLTNLERIKSFFSRNKEIVYIGHNILLYDLRVISKLLGIEIHYTRVIDTLALSWYLFPKEFNDEGNIINKKQHGLEIWGEYFKIPKVKIDDWKNLTQEDYIKRCERDVEINYQLYLKEEKYLLDLYSSSDRADVLVEYLMFKLDCIKEQEDNPLKLDIKGINSSLETLLELFNNKKKELEAVMPKVAKYKDKVVNDVIILDAESRPTKYVTAKENPIEFQNLLVEGHIPIKKTKVKIFKEWEEPNANSVDQKKAFLFSLGWEPLWFKDSEETKKKVKTGVIKKVPQINSENEEGELCESVKDLFNTCPQLEALQGIGRITHRMGILKGFLENQIKTKPGYIQASLSGFTNTLRLKHRNVVNLPSKGKDYWELIRGAFICEENELLCGSDCSQLEDNTKRHFIYPYDPEYVKEQMVKGYDAHLAIGVQANMFSQEDVDRYKELKHKFDDKEFTPSIEEKKFFENIEIQRKDAKIVNFSGVYGAGPPKIAATLKKPLDFARNLHKAYWTKNWAVKAVADACVVKTVNGQKWLFSPLSKLWYSLRAEKDRFSTLNQSAGVWVFDTWLRYIREKGVKIKLQYHDECLLSLERGKEEYIKEVLNEAMVKTNKKLKLNITISCESKFGENYSIVH